MDDLKNEYIEKYDILSNSADTIWKFGIFGKLEVCGNSSQNHIIQGCPWWIRLLNATCHN